MESTIPSFQIAVIQADLTEFGKRTPQVIGGYYPDVYYRTLNCFIIGEAKTDSDIDNHHTNAQIDSYILELRTGCQREKHIILSTSVYSFAMLFACSLFIFFSSKLPSFLFPKYPLLPPHIQKQ